MRHSYPTARPPVSLHLYTNRYCPSAPGLATLSRLLCTCGLPVGTLAFTPTSAPSSASLSRKSLHNSAKLSLLPAPGPSPPPAPALAALLAGRSSGVPAPLALALSALVAVETRRKGMKRSGAADCVAGGGAPGRERPAASFCSACRGGRCWFEGLVREGERGRRTVGPAEECGDEFENLELLRVGAVEGEEVEEVIGYELAECAGRRGLARISFGLTGMRACVGDDLPVDIVFWLAFFEEAQSFREVIVQDDGLVAQLADEQVLLLDLLLKRQRPLELLLRRVEGGLGLL